MLISLAYFINHKDIEFMDNYPCFVSSFAEVFGNEEVELNEQTLTTFLNKSKRALCDIIDEVREDYDWYLEDEIKELGDAVGYYVCERCSGDGNAQSEILDMLTDLPAKKAMPHVVRLLEIWLQR